MTKYNLNTFFIRKLNNDTRWGVCYAILWPGGGVRRHFSKFVSQDNKIVISSIMQRKKSVVFLTLWDKKRYYRRSTVQGKRAGLIQKPRNKTQLKPQSDIKEQSNSNVVSTVVGLIRELFDDKEEIGLSDIYKRKVVNKRKLYIRKKKHDILSLSQISLITSFENVSLFYKRIYGYFEDKFDINSFWWFIDKRTVVNVDKNNHIGKKLKTQRIVSNVVLLNDFRNVKNFFSQIIKFTTYEDVRLVGFTFQPTYLYCRTYLKNAAVYKTKCKPMLFIKQKIPKTNKHAIFVITGFDLISLVKDWRRAQEYLKKHLDNKKVELNFINTIDGSVVFINHHRSLNTEQLYEKYKYIKCLNVHQKFKAYFDNYGEYSTTKLTNTPNRNLIFKVDLYDSNYRVSYYFAILKNWVNFLSKTKKLFKNFLASDEKLITIFLFILIGSRNVFYKIFSVTNPIFLRLLEAVADTFKFNKRELVEAVALIKCFLLFFFSLVLMLVYIYCTHTYYTPEHRIVETLRYVSENFLSPSNSTRTLYYSHLLNGSYPRQFEMADGLTNDFIQERLLSELIKTIRDPLAASQYYSAPEGWDPITAAKNPWWIKDLSIEDVESIHLFMKFTYDRFEDDRQVFYLLWSSLHPDFIEFFKTANYEEGLIAQYVIRSLLMYSNSDFE